MTAMIAQQIETLYQQESRRIFATLVRLLGDMDLAEDMLQEAFNAALRQWPMEGIPGNPRAWLVSAGRFKGIDQLRRRCKQAYLDDLDEAAVLAVDDGDHMPVAIDDDRLRLIFTCCHPALAQDIQVALTLREVCGLSTGAIARSFLVSSTTMAQRLVRGKNKIRQAGIPYIIPEYGELPERLETVLQVVYLVYNEGYSAPQPPAPHPDLCQEGIRLGRLLVELLPDAEALGLLALMLLHESRRVTRLSDAGDIVLLQDQDRNLWNREYIAEALALLNRAFASGEVGSYVLEAAIAAEHARADHLADTDWSRIVLLYDCLYQANPSPIVALNQAVAVAMRDGPAEGIQRIDTLLNEPALRNYHLAYAARADLHRRCGQLQQARADYVQALALATHEPQRAFLQRKIDTLPG